MRKILKLISIILQLYIFRSTKDESVFYLNDNNIFNKYDLSFSEEEKVINVTIFGEALFESYNSIIDYFNSHIEKGVKSFHFFSVVSNNQDVKNDWEISRLNYITKISLIDEGVSEDLLYEIIKSKVITNVGYSVHWKCAMDVGIRAINVLLNIELLEKKHIEKRFYENTINFIILNLERYGEWRGNHYLTNIVSLLILTSKIDSEKSNRIFDFALSELSIELDRQFNIDGTNFEGSTAYHHFGLELLSITHTVLKKFDYRNRKEHYRNPFLFTNLGLKKCKYDPELFINFMSRLEAKIKKGLDFSLETLDQKGNLIQIGDNDSGKVFRTCYTNKYNPEFYADLYYQINESLNSGYFPCRVEDEEFYVNYLNSMREKKLAKFHNNFELEKFNSLYASSAVLSKRNFSFKIKDQTFPNSIKYFIDFGLIICRGDHSVLTFRCGQIGQLGKGGHDHYDQLSLTLSDFGKRIIADPGVGCYTKDEDVRNLYRSSKVHFGLTGKSECDDFSNLFSITSTPSEVVMIFENKILGKQINKKGIEKYRLLEFITGEIIIRDVIVNDEICNNYEKIPYSPGYGIIEND